MRARGSRKRIADPDASCSPVQAVQDQEQDRHSFEKTSCLVGNIRVKYPGVPAPPRPWWHHGDAAIKVALETGLACKDCGEEDPHKMQKAYTYFRKWVMCYECTKRYQREAFKRYYDRRKAMWAEAEAEVRAAFEGKS